MDHCFQASTKLNAAYKSDTADLTTTERVELWGRPHEDIRFNMEVDTVTFQTDAIPLSPAKLLLNGEKVDFDPFSGEAYGPVVLGGSTVIEVEAEFPWGVMKSGPLTVKEPNMSITFEFTDDMESVLATTIGDYYRSYLESFETEGDLPLKHVTGEFNRKVVESLKTKGTEGYTTQLWVKNKEIQLGDSYLTQYDGKYFTNVNVRMDYFESNFLTEEGPGDPGFHNQTLQYNLVYDNGWKVNDVQYSSMDYEEDFNETRSVMRDSGVYQLVIPARETTLETNSTPVLPAMDPAQFIINFRNMYENALNAVDFSIAEDYLLYDSDAYHELKDYIETEVDDSFEFNFTLNDPLSVETSEDGAKVRMHEKFIFTHNGDRTDYNREKVYHLTIDSEESYKITRIDILETLRD